MKRSAFLRNTGLTLVSLGLFESRLLAQLFSPKDFQVKMLTEDIGIFNEKGGTILFFLSADGPVVIDAQFPDSALHLIDEVKKRSVKPFRLLINTHHHADHTAGNIAFKDIVPHILAHENSKVNQQNSAVKQKSEDKQLYPDQTYTTTWSEKFGKEIITLYYFGAGHTNGDSIVHLKHANIIHMGDLVFNRRHPYIDKSAGASISNWIKLLEQTSNNFSADSKYICGHAAQGYETVVKRDDLLLFRDYLGNLLKFVDSEMKAGKTKDDILKATGIPGSPEWAGEGIERPLAAALIELMPE